MTDHLTDLSVSQHIVNRVLQILREGVPEAVEKPGDFQNEKGMLCCGKCRKPKETLIRFSDSGPERRVPVGCLCARTEEQARAKARRWSSAGRRASAGSKFMRDIGIADLPRATFRTDDHRNRSSSDTLTRYCEKFGKALERNLGLLLYGEPGSGKAFFAECIANELKPRGDFVWMRSVGAVASGLNGDYRSQVLEMP